MPSPIEYYSAFSVLILGGLSPGSENIGGGGGGGGAIASQPLIPPPLASTEPTRSVEAY